MLSDNSAVATIPVKKLDRARDFYSDKLGLTVEEERPGVITYRSGESKVFVYESEYAGGNKATAATWAVNDIDQVVSDLTAKGVRFEHYANLEGLRPEGDLYVGRDMKVAWLKDPDGNILSLVSG